MNKLRLILMTASMLILFAVCAFQAQAQATRTWVSGVGDDANPCSRTAPCKTLAGAISKTAAGGEINAIDSGGFGAVTITKSITIDLASVLGGVLATGTNGIVINGTDIVVTLRNLDINSGVNGVRILNAKTVNIENSTIYNFSNIGVSDERITGGSLFINNSIIRNNVKANVRISTASTPAVTASLSHVQLKSSELGIAVGSGSKTTIGNSLIADNKYFGIVAFDANTNVAAQDSVVSGNFYGVAITQSNAVIRISNLLVTQNNTGLFVAGGSGGQILSFGDNKITGNSTENPVTGIISKQ